MAALEQQDQDQDQVQQDQEQADQEQVPELLLRRSESTGRVIRKKVSHPIGMAFLL